MRLGRSIRALRQRRGWRQEDLASAARVSQSAVSRIELGDVRGASIERLEAIATALGARLHVRLDWHGESLDRLVDADHAATVEAVVKLLRDAGWEVHAEATFNIYGERGSIDVLGWHPARGVVVVVEVKASLGDLQDTLSTHDRKLRLAPRLARERGWNVQASGALLVVADGRTARRRIEDHRDLFAAAYPTRSWAVRSWLREPLGPMRGLLLLPVTQSVGRRRRRRVRVTSKPARGGPVTRPAGD